MAVSVPSLSSCHQLHEAILKEENFWELGQNISGGWPSRPLPLLLPLIRTTENHPENIKPIAGREVILDRVLLSLELPIPESNHPFCQASPSLLTPSYQHLNLGFPVLSTAE